MPDRQQSVVEPHSSTAIHADTGETREAYDLWSLGYDDDDRWICVGDNCGVEVIPCCWKWSETMERFLTKQGRPAKVPPYFRAEGGHAPGCNATLHTGPRDHTPPEYCLRVPGAYPAWVKLNREVPTRGQVRLEPAKDAPAAEQSGQRARPTYGIQEACAYFADNRDQHHRPLRVQGCPGLTYADVFARLGADARKLGKNWIFYDQLWFSEFVDLRAGTDTFVLPLLTTVRGRPRHLVVHTSTWSLGLRESLRKRLLAAIMDAKAARRDRRPERPWIFFYGNEVDRDQFAYEVDLQPGIGVLVRDLTWAWTFQPSNGFRRGKRWQPEDTGAYAPLDIAVFPHADDAFGSVSLNASDHEGSHPSGEGDEPTKSTEMDHKAETMSEESSSGTQMSNAATAHPALEPLRPTAYVPLQAPTVHPRRSIIPSLRKSDAAKDVWNGPAGPAPSSTEKPPGRIRRFINALTSIGR
ncbi:MAG: hypothetical protein AB7F35_28545 [Acetobacteraceae bacterium]